MTTHSIELTDALDRFVAQQIEHGGYKDASEVVRASLRLLQAQDRAYAARLERLRAAVQVGLDSYERGDGEVVDDLTAYFDRLEAELDQEEAEAERKMGTSASAE